MWISQKFLSEPFLQNTSGQRLLLKNARKLLAKIFITDLEIYKKFLQYSLEIYWILTWSLTDAAQKMKFPIKDFFSKCDQSRRKLRIWSHLLKKSLIENLFFCAVGIMIFPNNTFSIRICSYKWKTSYNWRSSVPPVWNYSIFTKAIIGKTHWFLEISLAWTGPWSFQNRNDFSDLRQITRTFLKPFRFRKYW